MTIRRYFPGPLLCRLGWHRYVGVWPGDRIGCVWCPKRKVWHG